ncbi:MAG TPA: tetratricopeptide repeat protein, partial [Bacteroidetes bacterium]|nr:tetratricopeptide repeat protein [Bacteroidota bacterium]
ENAFIQVKAMGKRKKDGGRKLLEFSTKMTKEEQYKLAKRCLNEVIKIGNTYYSQKAQKQKLEIELKLIDDGHNNDIVYINDLIKAFDDYISITKKEEEMFWAELHKARIFAFKLHQFETAEKLLKDLELKSVYKKEYQIESKLSLGDISLFSGDPWTAILLFSQIEKGYDNTPKADLAKYKTALVSFYLGDFEWSQAQLDAIKGSTSKLIANDAIRLSSFIQNNYGLDSIETPLEWFAQAKLFEYQENHKKCMLYLDSLEQFYSGHTLIDDVYFLRSELYKKEKNFEEEVKFLTKVVDEYPYDLLADKAIYRLAQIQELHYKDLDKAYKLYEKIILDYSDSLFVIQSRKKYRKLKLNLSKDDRI